MHAYTVVKAAASVAAAAVLATGCGGSSGPKVSQPPPAAAAQIRLESPGLRPDGKLPVDLTCDGAGRSPALSWRGVPDRTRELALFLDDPDAPGGTFPHWTLWHLKPSVHGLRPGSFPAGAREAENGAGKPDFTPACPPEGDEPHRYVFTLVALRAPLTLPAGAGPDEVRKAAYARALARGTLVGRYGR